MTDLETRLAQARAGIMPNDVSEMAASHRRAFDAAAKIAREVVAEKDAAYKRLLSDWKALGPALVEAESETRKVSDAQRRAVEQYFYSEFMIPDYKQCAEEVCSIFESGGHKYSPAEIARLKGIVDSCFSGECALNAESRKVSDAQRERFYERLERDVNRSLATIIGNDLLAIIESLADVKVTV